MSFVHQINPLSSTETAHRDVAIGPVADAESADLGRCKSDVGRRLAGIRRIPESGSCGGELAGDGEG